MKVIALLGLVLLLAGCASSTVASRIKERSAAFSQLTSEEQGLVQAGQIKIGLPSDAVYMAWGAPSDLVEREDAQGHVTTWIYYGQTVEESRYWTFEEVAPSGASPFLERRLQSEFFPRIYIRAEIDFVNDKVVRWRTLPKPPIY